VQRNAADTVTVRLNSNLKTKEGQAEVREVFATLGAASQVVLFNMGCVRPGKRLAPICTRRTTGAL